MKSTCERSTISARCEPASALNCSVDLLRPADIQPPGQVHLGDPGRDLFGFQAHAPASSSTWDRQHQPVGRADARPCDIARVLAQQADAEAALARHILVCAGIAALQRIVLFALVLQRQAQPAWFGDQAQADLLSVHPRHRPGVADDVGDRFLQAQPQRVFGAVRRD